MRNKTIYNRSPKDKNNTYSVISNEILNLNPYQRLIMIEILRNKDTWVIYKCNIKKNIKIPSNKFEKAWKLLKEYGFIRTTKIDGGYLYTINEKPNFGNDNVNNTGDIHVNNTGDILLNTKNYY